MTNLVLHAEAGICYEHIYNSAVPDEIHTMRQSFRHLLSDNDTAQLKLTTFTLQCQQMSFNRQIIFGRKSKILYQRYILKLNKKFENLVTINETKPL